MRSNVLERMTVTALNKKCRELNLKLSGVKQDLIDRIQQEEGNLLSEIRLSDTLQKDFRTRGKKFPLAGKEQELERILGIRSRSSGHVDFQNFAKMWNQEHLSHRILLRFIVNSTKNILISKPWRTGLMAQNLLSLSLQKQCYSPI